MNLDFDPEQLAKRSVMWIAFFATLGAAMLVLNFAFGMAAMGAERQKTANISHRDCVVMLTRANRQASGVVIDREGWALTAGHFLQGCIPQEKIEAKFSDGATYPAEAAKGWPHLDIGAVQIKADVKLLAVAVAEQPPAVGDPVVSEGFPNGKFSRMEGEVKLFGPIRTIQNGKASNPYHVVRTNYRVQSGNSGGPLYNSAGELIGIASTSTFETDQNVESDFSWIGPVRAVMQRQGIGANAYAGPAEGGFHLGLFGPVANQRKNGKPDLIVIWSHGCGPCVEFEADYGKDGPPRNPQLRAFLDAHFNVKFCGWEEARHLRRQHGIIQSPAFVPSVGTAWTGYDHRNPQEFLTELAKSTRIGPGYPPGDNSTAQLPGIMTPPANHGSALSAVGPGLFAFIPGTQFPDSHLQDVTVVVLVKKSGKIGWWNTPASVLERVAEGQVKHQILQEFQGKIVVELVFERVEPKRYRRIADTAGAIDSDERPVSIAVLIKKHERGAFTDFIVDRIKKSLETTVERKLKDAPVHAYFERVSKGDFDRIETALKTMDEDDSDLPIVPAAFLCGLLGTGPGTRGIRAYLERLAVAKGMKGVKS